MSDPKYFKRAMVSPTAAMKMLMHTYSGCEKGMREGGKPLEVMGMMLGRPHTEQLDTLVVTDVFPLPVEGFETRVIADDEQARLSKRHRRSRARRLPIRPSFTFFVSCARARARARR